jgi:tRNA pseudouridine38-40 synthase
MRNIRLIIQYDGTNYHGWQIQPNGITIQEVLQEHIQKITGETSSVIGAGRTDAGVHAIGQVVSFQTSSHLSPEIIKKALNATLPSDIRVIGAAEAEESFNPRFDAKSKSYVYIIANSRYVSPFLYRYAWRIPYELDIAAMRSALQYLKGTHDFSSFRGSGCDAKTLTKTVFEIFCDRSGSLDFMAMKLNGPFIVFAIEADAFLRHMVRTIVGTAVEVGRGRFKAPDMSLILQSMDRSLAGPTAPAQGLFLKRVYY